MDFEIFDAREDVIGKRFIVVVHKRKSSLCLES